MKKFIYTLLVAVLAFSFMGCPSVHEGLEPLIDASVLKVRGTIQPEEWSGSGEDLKSDGKGSFIYTFVAKSDSANFAIDDGGWGTTYRGDADGKLLELEVGKAVKAYPLNSPDCPKLTGLTVQTNYTVKVTPYSSYVEIEVIEGEANVPALYVLDSTAGAVKMTYDGTQYKYTAKATSDKLSLHVWTNEKYLKGTYALGAEDAAALTIEDKVYTVDITGVTSGSEYFVYVTYDEENETATVKAEDALPKVYLAGEAPFEWNLGSGKAVQASIVGTTTWYYYTFEAKATSLNFKVALKDAWSDAYSNNKKENEVTTDNKTTIDSAPITYEFANAENSVIEGLTVGEKYTILIDISSGKPAVSVITGEDILFAIGNDDFGGWKWESCKTMTPAGAGEWKYEFEATNADAQFKFQTKCGGWNDSATWNAKAALTLGADYVDMSNGAGDPNTSATLTVGKTYVLSVKKATDKYQVKIAEKQ